MRKLIMHHTYAQGAAVDVSGNRNHGQVTHAAPGSTSTLLFQQADSRVRVWPTRSLQRLASIRAQVRFRLDPAALPVRHNLMEGHLSFALFIERDFSLMGTILDANNLWRGARSQLWKIQPGQWHIADLTYVDSAARLDVTLDGAKVGSLAGVAGPVRPVSKYGVSIGNWPDANNYALRGEVDEAKLWATWPEFDDFLDDCCADFKGLDGLVEKLRDDPKVQSREVEPSEILRGLLRISGRLRARIVNGDPGRSAEVQKVERAFDSAYRSRDTDGMLRAGAAGLRLFVAAGVPMAELEANGREGLDLLRSVQLGRSLLDPIIAMAKPTAGVRLAARFGRRRVLPDVTVDIPPELGDLLDHASSFLCLPSPPKRGLGPSPTEPPRHWGEVPTPQWPPPPRRDASVEGRGLDPPSRAYRGRRGPTDERDDGPGEGPPRSRRRRRERGESP